LRYSLGLARLYHSFRFLPSAPQTNFHHPSNKPVRYGALSWCIIHISGTPQVTSPFCIHFRLLKYIPCGFNLIICAHKYPLFNSAYASGHLLNLYSSFSLIPVLEIGFEVYFSTLV
jgi:hypothetical protein